MKVGHHLTTPFHSFSFSFVEHKKRCLAKCQCCTFALNESSNFHIWVNNSFMIYTCPIRARNWICECVISCGDFFIVFFYTCPGAVTLTCACLHVKVQNRCDAALHWHYNSFLSKIFILLVSFTNLSWHWVGWVDWTDSIVKKIKLCDNGKDLGCEMKVFRLFYEILTIGFLILYYLCTFWWNNYFQQKFKM